MNVLHTTGRLVEPPTRRRIKYFRDGYATSKHRRLRKHIVVPVWRRRAVEMRVAA